MTLDHSLFDEINANLRALEIDEIKKLLEPLIKGIQRSESLDARQQDMSGPQSHQDELQMAPAYDQKAETKSENIGVPTSTRAGS
jgi:hypothetical protein